MISDARELPENEELECDLCIVGGGPAGITLAREMIGSPLRVILLESGDLGYEDDTQSLYQGESVGLKVTPMDRTRLRILGGSSNHWAGNCMQLSDFDFEKKDWMPFSGWPIRRAELDPFYERARSYVELPDVANFDLDFWLDKVGPSPLPFNPELITLAQSYQSPPTAFGDVYYDDMEAAENLRVFLNANVQTLETEETARQVERAHVACINGPKFSVRAKRFVVAVGGMETPRLLLLSNDVAKNGLGNDNDLVGRFFADSVRLQTSFFLFSGRRHSDFDLYTDLQEYQDQTTRFYLLSSPELQRREEIGGFSFVLRNADATPGQKSLVRLSRMMRSGDLENVGMHLGNLVTDLDGAANAIASRGFGLRAHLIPRNWLSPSFGIDCFPEPSSRVTLSDQRDLFGQQQLKLDWRLHERDLVTAKRAVQIMTSELGRMGYGRVWSQVLQDDFTWPDYVDSGLTFVLDGKHHMGTARMSEDPKQGVVDPHGRVHSVDNLYVAGSAVFPTHGRGTPTLTIVALSIRMADKFKEDLRRNAL